MGELEYVAHACSVSQHVLCVGNTVGCSEELYLDLCYYFFKFLSSVLKENECFNLPHAKKLRKANLLANAPTSDLRIPTVLLPIEPHSAFPSLIGPPIHGESNLSLLHLQVEQIFPLNIIMISAVMKNMKKYGKIFLRIS